jgi:hypothetical protein
MALNVHIDAKAKIFRLFDLQQLMGEMDLDISSFDLTQSDEIARLYKRVTEFVETGEIGAYDDMLFHVHGIDPEVCEITLRESSEKVVAPDDITLKNKTFSHLINELTKMEEERVLFATLTTGDAVWDFESDIEAGDIDPSLLSLGYYDCSKELDQYGVLESALLEPLCDMLSTDEIGYDGKTFQLADFVLHPGRVYGQLFVVRTLTDTETKVLTRIDPPNLELQDIGWQLLQNFSDEV